MDLASGVLNDGHEDGQTRVQHTAADAFRRWGSALLLAAVVPACSSSGDGAAPPAAAGAGGTTSVGGSSNAGPGGSGAGGQAAAGGAGASGAGTAGAAGGGASGQTGGGGQGQAGGATTPGDFDPIPVGADRPTKVYVPGSYAAGKPMPLVILLHGYGASGAIQDAYFQLKAQAEARGFLYAHPDGTLDTMNKRFWNATDACCDFGAPKIDDVAYLSGLVTEISARWSVDPKRVHFVGHSNGGFMSHRMACDKADVVASIVSLAGDNWNDASLCKPTAPVAVLQVHGTADTVIAYAGGMTTTKFPSAQQSVLDWVALDGCDATPDTSLPPLDLDNGLPGNETTIQRWATGCKAGSEAQLWTIVGGAHIPSLTNNFAPDVVGFLFDHPKP